MEGENCPSTSGRAENQQLMLICGGWREFDKILSYKEKWALWNLFLRTIIAEPNVRDRKKWGIWIFALILKAKNLEF